MKNTEAYATMIENMREKYCSHISKINYGHSETVEKSEKSCPTGNILPLDKKQVNTKEKPKHIKEGIKPDVSGGSGVKHRYLQNLIKKLGQERGFYTVIESPVFNGHGSVDVALEGHGKKIAIEVSVTTAGKWEGSNITKCFSAGYDEVIIISSEAPHLLEVKKQVSGEFVSEIEGGRLLFLQIEELINHLETVSSNKEDAVNTIDGYSVTVGYTETDPQEMKIREDAIAKILLGH